MFGFPFTLWQPDPTISSPCHESPRITSAPQVALTMQDGGSRIGADVISIINSRWKIQCAKSSKLILSCVLCVCWDADRQLPNRFGVWDHGLNLSWLTVDLSSDRTTCGMASNVCAERVLRTTQYGSRTSLAFHLTHCGRSQIVWNAQKEPGSSIQWNFLQWGNVMYLLCPIHLATSAMWLLSTWHVTSVTEEMHF